MVYSFCLMTLSIYSLAQWKYQEKASRQRVTSAYNQYTKIDRWLKLKKSEKPRFGVLSIRVITMKINRFLNSCSIGIRMQFVLI